MADDQVQFLSPTTGKVQAVPSEHWEEALSNGYTPTTHKVMYSPTGERGMVPNGQLKDYVKQGYQTTPQTQFEKNVTGEGISLKGAGTAAWNTVKGMMPPGPEGPILSKRYWLGKNRTVFSWAPNEQSGIGQMAQEGSKEYQRATAAGTNPLAAGYSAAISGAGPLVGISDTAQQKLAEQGEGGQIIGQSAVPLAATALSPLAGKYAPAISKGLQDLTPPGMIDPIEAAKAGYGLVRHPGPTIAKYVAKNLFGELGTGAIDPRAAHAEMEADIAKGRQQRAAAYDEMNKDFAKRSAAEAKAARKGAAKPPPPSPFSPEATSSAAVGPESFVPQESRNLTPFQPVTQGPITGTGPLGEVQGIQGITPPPRQVAAPPPTAEGLITEGGKQPTSLLSRGRTLVQPGMEPDLNNPTHVKMINDYQTMSGPALRLLSEAGDRFAAFVLRHMPRP